MSHKHSHNDGHGHSHGHLPSDTNTYLNRAFIAGIVLNLVFVAAEFIAGWIYDSLALISDAGHNLSDVVSLALAMLAFRLSRLKPTEKYTYGRKKSTVVVSLANACILLVVIGVILWESVGKLLDPRPVEGEAIAWVAGIGIVVNGFTAWLFMRHRKTDLNVKGAYLHMAADALVSAGVVVSGIVISFTGWYLLDPIIGIVIAVVIFISTWDLLRDSVRLSLDGVPRDIDLHEVAETVKGADPAVEGLHHLHIWPLSTTENALTAHILIRSADDATRVKEKVREALARQGITHATLETELTSEPHPECTADIICNE